MKKVKPLMMLLFVIMFVYFPSYVANAQTLSDKAEVTEVTVVQIKDESDAVVFSKEASEKTRYVSAKTGLNYRKSPSKDGKVMGALPYNSAVTVVCEYNDSWSLVKINGKHYFMYSEYLVKAKVEHKSSNPVASKAKVESKETKTAKKVSGTNLGQYKLTAYCSCSKCCGKNSDGITASGAQCIEGVTVASNTLPFGTKISIDGHVYTVQDRGGGLSSNQIDIYFNSHRAALDWGVKYKDIYLIE